MARRRLRRFQGSARRLSLGWNGVVVGSGEAEATFDADTDIANVFLVTLTDYLVSPAGTGFVNIKRIVGDAWLRPSASVILAGATWSAAYYWAIFIEDADEPNIADPSSSGDLRDETVLAHGCGNLFGSAEPPAAQQRNIINMNNWHIDVKSNRRVTENQVCAFRLTVANATGLGGAEALSFGLSLRTLITTTPRTE